MYIYIYIYISMHVSFRVHSALVEPALAQAASSPVRSTDRPAFQFQRMGFFCVDTDSTTAAPIFNQVVALKEDKEKAKA